jgi:ribosome-associated toxin RatA of RatAB toxin-antitoxin module
MLLNPQELIIETESIQSKLFDSLPRSRWKLAEIKDGAHKGDCKVNFEVEMAVSDPLIMATLDEVLKQVHVACRQVDAFEKRCRQLPLPADLEDLDSPKQ